MSLWIACYIVAQCSPPIGAAIGWGLYIIYSGICVVAFFFVRYCMVETRGKTLEEMTRVFGIEGRLAQNSGVDVEDAEYLKTRSEITKSEDFK